MMWVYAVILAVSAGLCTVLLARGMKRFAIFLGIVALPHNVLGFAALAALLFLMVAQAPAMVLTAALMLWFAGTRHAQSPLSIPVQIGLMSIVVILGIAALGTASFALPSALPKAVIMGAIALVWILLLFFPQGTPSRGHIISYLVSLLIFVLGAVVFRLPLDLAGDAMVMAGALGGALMCLGVVATHAHKAGEWVWLYLLGFLAASAAYAGVWWLGLLGIAPVCVYALIRRS